MDNNVVGGSDNSAPEPAEDWAAWAARTLTDEAMEFWRAAFGEGVRNGMAAGLEAAAHTVTVTAGALPAGMARVGGTVMATEQVVDLLMNLRDRILMQAHAIEDPEPPTVGDPR